ncbi:MAG TPA: beta-aspartyl-peptidase [Bacteroidales bacterium]|jgi:beta-aspartyl-dipeptidase (metallo-type)|nr:beta-aspartyl-peptidase [Bacteroidales bacterium]
MFTLFKNADVYAPEFIGRKDILVGGGKILAIGENLEAPAGYDCEVISAEGLKVVPGFIDAHVHIAGAGGEGGPSTRTPELQLSMLVEAGVTTVIGCLGTDGMTRTVESVLMKAKGLRAEGVSSWIYTGSYQIPTPTITGDVGRDIALIDEVIGVGEIALSDHRSSWPNTDELLRLVEHARVGGMLGGKAGIVNIHLGDQQEPFQPMYDVIERSHGMLKLTQFFPTHCNRNDYTLESAKEFAKRGGYIDITTSSYPYFPEYEVKPSKCIPLLLEAGIPIEKITFTSDACGSLPGFDENGNLVKLEMGLPSANFRELMDAVNQEGVPLEIAVKVLTSNPADILKLHQKGRIAVGKDADLVFIDNQRIYHVMAMGKFMMKDAQILKKGSYEK